MKWIILVFQILINSCLHTYAQQKAAYSEYLFTPSVINPAAIATDNAYKLSLNARQQWAGFKGSPNNQTLTARLPIIDKKTFVGFQVNREQIGEVISENGFYSMISQNIAISDNLNLAFALQGGFGVFSASYQSLFSESANSVNDPNFANAKNQINGAIGAGLMLFSDRFFMGLSSPHLYYFSDQQNSLKPHFFITTGYLTGNQFSVLRFKPNFLLKYVDGAPVQLDINLSALLSEKVWIGLSYQSFAGMSFTSQIDVTDRFQFGYAYDFALTDLRKKQYGTHEILLQFRLPTRNQELKKCYF